MDLKKIKKLIDLLGNYPVQEIEIEEEGSRLKISFQSPDGSNGNQRGPESWLIGNQGNAMHGDGAGEPGSPKIPEGTKVLTSPMIGTFFRAPAPGKEPFAKKGSRIKAGATLCIIEAMKVMNEIKADEDGEIVEFLVKNEEPVEFGQPLMVIKPS